MKFTIINDNKAQVVLSIYISWFINYCYSLVPYFVTTGTLTTTTPFSFMTSTGINKARSSSCFKLFHSIQSPKDQTKEQVGVDFDLSSSSSTSTQQKDSQEIVNNHQYTNDYSIDNEINLKSLSTLSRKKIKELP